MENVCDCFGTPIDEGDWVIYRRFAKVLVSQVTYSGSGAVAWSGGGGMPLNPTIIEDKALVRLDDVEEHGVRVHPRAIDTVHVSRNGYRTRTPASVCRDLMNARIERRAQEHCAGRPEECQWDYEEKLRRQYRFCREERQAPESSRES